jgi:hypothetical protein
MLEQEVLEADGKRVAIIRLLRELIEDGGQLQGLRHVDVVLWMKIGSEQHEMVAVEDADPVVSLLA